GVHEAAAEGVRGERPPEGVDDGVERLLRFPDLLDAEGEDLRVLAPYALPLEPGLGEEPARAFGEGRDLGDDVGRRHVAPGRLAAAVEPRRRGPDACDAVAVDEELAGGEAGEDVDAEPLGLFAE